MTLSVSSKRFQGDDVYYKSEAGNLGRKCEGLRRKLEAQGSLKDEVAGDGLWMKGEEEEEERR